ncbi:MAG: carbohydrate-binding domain-containing protein, partial [Clostridiales bacterium]|nr:carbohydrate-binding domain-containing protein [Clostridiales bacterium]
MKTQRKILMTLILIIAAALLLTASAFAKEYMLSEESIGFQVTGHADGTQEVYHYSDGTTDDILENEEIIFKGEGNCFIDLLAEAKVTLNSVNITNSSPVYIYDNANAAITIRGDNTLTNDEDGSGNGIITVNDGNLTIKGDGKLTLVGDTYGAKIGSEVVEAMSGTIHITDHVEIITDDEDCWGDDGWCDGACIGSGVDGAFTGEVKIDGNSEVTAVSNHIGAGIGTGYMGKFTGRVIIGENAIVHAQSGANGAGIGTGHGNKSDFAGEIRIEGNADVTAVSRNSGAGIGVGYGGDFKSQGKVIIEGSARVFAITKYLNGAGIGSCEDGNFGGSVIIRGNAIVHAKSGYMGAGIGSGVGGEDGHFLSEGQVIIEENAIVHAQSGANGAGIGSGGGCDFKGDIIIRGNSTVHAESVRGGAGIGTGGAGDFASGGRVIIEGSANVTAITNSNGVFSSNGAGIGTGHQA